MSKKETDETAMLPAAEEEEDLPEVDEEVGDDEGEENEHTVVKASSIAKHDLIGEDMTKEDIALDEIFKDNTEVLEVADDSDVKQLTKLEDVEDEDNESIGREHKEARQKRRRAGCCFCFVILLLILFLTLLGFFFRIDREGSTTIFSPPSASPTTSNTKSPSGAITPSPTLLPTTGVPTSSNTAAPTSSPISIITTEPTSSPTRMPTTSPSSSPTRESEFPEISDLDCENIRLEKNVSEGRLGGGNFRNFPSPSGQDVCADSYGGEDPREPGRSLWAVRRGRRDCPRRDIFQMNEACTSIGARLCSLTELEGRVAQGTGCGGDREFVWSSTPCNEDDNEGFFMFDFGLRDSKQAIKCESNLQTISVVRCCGDNS